MRGKPFSFSGIGEKVKIISLPQNSMCKFGSTQVKECIIVKKSYFGIRIALNIFGSYEKLNEILQKEMMQMELHQRQYQIRATWVGDKAKEGRVDELVKYYIEEVGKIMKDAGIMVEIVNGTEGEYVDVTGTATAVPEPTTILLLGSGLIGLAGDGRKKLLKN